MAHPFDLEDANEPYIKYEMLGGVIYGEPPYEIWGGEKVILSSPSYNHCSIDGMLVKIFLDYIINNRILATVMGDNFDVHLSREYHCKPDISVICDLKRLRNQKRLYGPPDLIVEILSKSTANKDKVEKKEKYEEFGVREYWIADPDKKSIQVYHLVEGKYVDAGEYHYDGSGAGDKIKVSIFDDMIVDVPLVFKFVMEFENEEEDE